MFEDEVRLLIPIMRNYNRYITDERSAENSTGMFVQYGYLKDLMQKNGHVFSVDTEPMFGRFRFTSVSFSSEFVEWFPLLTQLGFVEKEGCCTYFFGREAVGKEHRSCVLIGVVGRGAKSDLSTAISDYPEKKGICFD